MAAIADVLRETFSDPLTTTVVQDKAAEAAGATAVRKSGPRPAGEQTGETVISRNFKLIFLS